jgi:hypothetical protein
MTASKAILGDLDKMNLSIAENVRRVADGGDVPRVTPTVEGPAKNPRGANRPVAAQTMSAKIGSHRDVTRPSPKAPPTSGSKPPADWPTNSESFSSGLARPGRLGTMPSKTAR